MGAEAADDLFRSGGEALAVAEWERALVLREGGRAGESAEDLMIENGKVTGYRVRLGISFKYDSGD